MTERKEYKVKMNTVRLEKERKIIKEEIILKKMKGKEARKENKENIGRNHIKVNKRKKN